MGILSLTILTLSSREKFNVPEGCSDDVLRQKQYRKKSGEVTKFVW